MIQFCVIYDSILGLILRKPEFLENTVQLYRRRISVDILLCMPLGGRAVYNTTHVGVHGPRPRTLYLSFGIPELLVGSKGLRIEPGCVSTMPIHRRSLRIPHGRPNTSSVTFGHCHSNLP